MGDHEDARDKSKLGVRGLAAQKYIAQATFNERTASLSRVANMDALDGAQKKGDHQWGIWNRNLWENGRIDCNSGCDSQQISVEPP